MLSALVPYGFLLLYLIQACLFHNMFQPLIPYGVGQLQGHQLSTTTQQRFAHLTPSVSWWPSSGRDVSMPPPATRPWARCYYPNTSTFSSPKAKSCFSLPLQPGLSGPSTALLQLLPCTSVVVPKKAVASYFYQGDDGSPASLVTLSD